MAYVEFFVVGKVENQIWILTVLMTSQLKANRLQQKEPGSWADTLDARGSNWWQSNSTLRIKSQTISHANALKHTIKLIKSIGAWVLRKFISIFRKLLFNATIDMP